MAKTPPRHEPGEQTRTRLLDSAELLFARQGFACTSVRDITRHARCNVAAVNYHFGGKLNLYREMLLRRLAAMREQRVASIQTALQDGSGEVALEHVLRTFATAFLEPLVNESHGRLLIELIAREMLDPQLPPEMFRTEIFGPVQEALTAAVVAVTSGLHPEAARLCVMSILSQLIQVAHGARRDQLGSVASGGAPQLTTLVDHIVRFSMAGVRASRSGAA
jgi:AcrR family transcriptional regulator